MNDTEKNIIKQLKNGEDKAFRYLYDNHYSILCNIANSFLDDEFIAETIVGDIFFNLWEKRASIEIQISLRAYLVRSVRNRCINYLKQNYVVKEKRLSTSDDLLGIEALADLDDNIPLGYLLEKELELEIDYAIKRLPNESRTVFEMCRFEGLKYQEIADKLNISINTVKYHMKSALAKLKDDLGKYLSIIAIFEFFG